MVCGAKSMLSLGNHTPDKQRHTLHQDLSPRTCHVECLHVCGAKSMSSLGNYGADKQLSKGFARNREQSTYQSTGNGNSKASNNFCVLDFRVFNIHRPQKNTYIFQLQPTHNVFSSQGRKELKSY